MKPISELLMAFFNVLEGYQLIEKITDQLSEQTKRTAFFDYLIASSVDLSTDFLRDFFQSEHGDRDRLKQDYTPDSVCEVIASQVKDAKYVADICAGTGALSLAVLRKNPAAYLHVEELSDRAMPFLLTNLAIRNVSAEVIHCDVLTRQVKAVYLLTASEKYSTIEKTDILPPAREFDYVVMNPPYSLKWSPVAQLFNENFGLPPKNYADFQFVLYGLSLLADHGKLFAVLPHGVLFRSNAEGAIRTKICEARLLDSVIGLPDNLFMNTGIPVCILGLKQGKTDDKTIFIEASKQCKKQGPINIMTSEHLAKVISTLENRAVVDKFSSLISLDELKTNDFNLNIPRYVDTYVPPPEISLSLDEFISEIREIRKQELIAEARLLNGLMQLVGFSPKEVKEIITWKSENSLLMKSLKLSNQEKEKSTQLALF